MHLRGCGRRGVYGKRLLPADISRHVLDISEKRVRLLSFVRLSIVECGISMKRARKFLDHKSAFLEAFRETGSVIRAAEIVEVRRQMYYRWLKDDPSYAARFLALNVRANSNHSYEAKKRARRIRALADIADGTSDKLLIQIAELINASRK
jgi:hypothetical protein